MCSLNTEQLAVPDRLRRDDGEEDDVTMRKSSIASVLAIAVLGSSLSGCEEALMAVDPNRFDIQCEGELPFVFFDEELNGAKHTEPLSWTISVDLNEMVWCFRVDGDCGSVTDVYSVDRERIVLTFEDAQEEIDSTLFFLAPLFTSIPGFDYESPTFRQATLFRSTGDLYLNLIGLQTEPWVVYRASGTVACERRAFTNIEDNRKF
jgi:hypothetical protein